MAEVKGTDVQPKSVDPDQWKKKYFDALRSLEQEERGFRSLEALLRRIVNRLCFAAMGQSPVRHMLDLGIRVTINSDDPAYFGGYVNANFIAVAEALDLSEDQIATLAVNSFAGSFLPEAEKAEHIATIEMIRNASA